MILEAIAVSAGLGAIALAARHVRKIQAVRKGIRSDTTPPTTAPRGLRVGDVLLHGDIEYWLAGVLHLDEDGLVLRAFRCPNGADVSWVVQLDESADSLALCTPTDAVPEGSVPDTLPVEGFTFRLKRRGRARLTVEGSEVPRGASHVRYTELRGAAGRTLLVLDLDDGTRLALAGPLLERDRVELLPGGDLDAG